MGKADDRHLWPEMYRVIREVQPKYIVGENVRGITNWNGGVVFDEVQAEMEAEGYEVLPFLLPACGVNAPHRRDRIWFIAYQSGEQLKRNKAGVRREERKEGDRQTYRQTRAEFGGATDEDGAAANADGEQPPNDSRTPEEVGRDSKGNVSGEFSGDGASTNTNNTRADVGCGANKNGTAKDKGRQELTQSELGAGGGDVADANKTRLEKSRFKPGINPANERFGTKHNNSKTSSDNSSARLEREERRKEKEGLHNRRNKSFFANTDSSRRIQDNEEWASRQFKEEIQCWRNFPTQPPVCSGDDGLSALLDNITFPKWRNESIMGYGNAIVPQVAFKIYKAIEKFDKKRWKK